MFDLSGFQISFNSSPLFILLGIILLGLYSYFIYKITIPVISRKLKLLLLLLRILSVGLIFILIFEPIIRETEIDLIEPTTYVFIDNSQSIVQKDSTIAKENIIRILDDFQSNINGNVKYFSFGANVSEINYESVSDLAFNERFTDLESVTDLINQSDDNLTNILLLTDGIITTGTNPIKEIEDESIPFTVLALGDSTTIVDVSVKDIILNSYLYKGKETTLETIVLNTGFAARNVEVKLLENNNLISSKMVELNSSGINRIQFQYTPESAGENKLQVEVSQLVTEQNTINNRNIIFRNVSENKLRIGIISDSPSMDLSFVKNSLKIDEENELIEHITINGSKLISDSESSSYLDSVDIFYLLNFPTRNSKNEIMQKVFRRINESGIPFFLQISRSTDITKLSGINNLLPVTFITTNLNFVKAQFEIVDNFSSLLQINSKFESSFWTDLPPIFALNLGAMAKPESNVITSVKIKNVVTGQPLIVSKTEGSNRNIILLGEEIWRWKLNSSNNEEVFDQFIANTTAWLKADPGKQRFRIKLSKKVFSSGEEIDLSAELYDTKLAPMDDADISILFSNGETDKEIYLLNKGNGLYTNSWTTDIIGDLSYSAKAIKNGNILGTTSGKITVNKSDVERSQTQMNTQLLRDIALVSDGNYIDDFDIKPVVKAINESNSNAVEENKTTTEYQLWSNEYSLFLIIFFFALEWFLRKRNGMI